MIRAYLASTPDECAIPDPGGRLVTYSDGLLPPVSLMRMTIEGAVCFVQRWPGSTMPIPAALDHAKAWLLPAERRAAC